MNFDNVSRIAYLGPDASFCEMAKDWFVKKYDIKGYPTPMATVKQVFEFIESTPNTLGVLPVENSIIGTVRETLDYIMDSPNPKLQILSEMILPIEYCLLSRTTEFYSISGIIANHQALGQCHNFIQTEMPRNLNIVEVTTPSEAARSLSSYNLTYASIGSEKLAEVYNLNVLKSNINDDKTNRTHFVLIGAFETAPTGNDKTTMMFMAENRPGALMEILEIFNSNSINLSYISSRPSKNQPERYIFVVSFDGHIQDSIVKDTISQVQEKATYLKLMGSYEK